MVNRKEKVGVTGTLRLWNYNSDLTLKESRVIENLMLPMGLQWIAGRCIGGRRTLTLDGISVGTDNTAAASTDTELGALVDSNALIVDPWQGIGTDSNKFYCRTSFGTGEAVATLEEAGIYYGGNLFNRAVISPAVVKATDEVLVLEWEIAINAG